MRDPLESDGINHPEPEHLYPKVRELESKIAQANGNYIRLAKSSKFDKPLLLKVTHREFEPYEKDIKKFEKYQGKAAQNYMIPIRGVSWLTIFEEWGENDVEPIATYHWAIRGATFSDRTAYGAGSGSLSSDDYWDIIDSDPDLKKTQDKYQNRPASYLVDYEHQNSGIGTFILSASIAAMDAFDIKKFRPTSLLNASTRVWTRLGLINPDFDINSEEGKNRAYDHPIGTYLDVKEVLSNPKIQQSISDFV